MVTSARTFGIGVLVAVALLVVPDSAAAKCRPPSSPNVEMMQVPAYAVDGVPVTEDEFNALNGGDIETLTILCRDERNAETGAVVRRQPVVWVMTTTGRESMVRRILHDLATAQESFRAKTGRYSVTIGELSSPLSFAFGTLGRFRLTATDGGWSASVDGDAGRSCHIAVGAAELPHPGLAPGVPGCFPRQADTGA